MVPVESGLSGTWAATEDDKFKRVLASEWFGCDEVLSTKCQISVCCRKDKTAHTRLFEIRLHKGHRFK